MKIRCKIVTSSNFRKQYKKIIRQGKSVSKINKIINMLADNELLEDKYRDHILENSKKYLNCRECHIEPDLLLIYKYLDGKLILLLVSIGSHSELFR